jgi:hypothetical protein
MKCQSRISISVVGDPKKGRHLLIKGNVYECDPTPPVYDPTNPRLKPSYIVKCEDGKFRKYDVEYFIDVQELREQKLEELGI